jgi:hypothetical protein
MRGVGGLKRRDEEDEGCLALCGEQRLPRPLAGPVPVFLNLWNLWIRCLRRVRRVDTSQLQDCPAHTLRNRGERAGSAVILSYSIVDHRFAGS